MTGPRDDEPRRFARQMRARNTALLVAGCVALVAIGIQQAGAHDPTGSGLSWAAAVACGGLGWRTWSRGALWKNPKRVPGSTGDAAPTPPGVDPNASTWWFWVRPRLTTTTFELGDDHGEWLAEFDRHGPLGHRARAEDPDHDRVDLTLGADTAHPAATLEGDPIAEIDDARLRVGGRWLRIDLPRDGRFTCTVHDSNATLLRVTRAADGPFARVQVSDDLPERYAVVLLVLFVLTCDHDLANSIGGTLGSAS